jgi:hypothetical protein
METIYLDTLLLFGGTEVRSPGTRIGEPIKAAARDCNER